MRTAVLAILLAGTASLSQATSPPVPVCDPKAPVLTGAAATARNLEAVQGIYAAFGRGDVAAILACVSPAVQWESWADNHAQRASVPWLKKQTGPEGVAAFFAYVGKWKVNGFAVKNIMGAGANVAAEVEVDFDVTQTGGRIKDEELHYWTFDDRGLITGLRHYNDTAKHIAAAKGARD